MNKKEFEEKFKKELRKKKESNGIHYVEVILNNNASIFADDYVDYSDINSSLINFFINGHISGVCELENIKMLL